jgi:Galactose oxidase, central domain
MTYDTKDGYLVLFGGIDASGDVLGDTWTYRGGHWNLLHPTSSPPARDLAVMTFDAKDGYVLLFGGCGPGYCSALSDTWRFLNGTWTQLSPTASPAPVNGADMTYDAADGYVLLYGGYFNGGCYTDTWKFIAGTWTHLNTSSTPAQGCGTLMTYDGADRYALLYGGCCGAGNETWKFKAGQWSAVHPAALPPPLSNGGMIYDSKAHRLILFLGDLNQTWAYRAGAWTNLTSAGAPGGRAIPAFAYDPSAGAAILTGGCRACANYDLHPFGAAPLPVVGDTWEEANGVWTKLAAAYIDPTTASVSPSTATEPLWHPLPLTISVRDTSSVPIAPIGSFDCALRAVNASTGSCNLTYVPDLPVGLNSVQFSYLGDSYHVGKTAGVSLTVTKARTGTSITASSSSVKRLTTVNLTVSVANLDPAPTHCHYFFCAYRGPTGTVSWSDNGAGGTFANKGHCSLARWGFSSQAGRCTVSYVAPSTVGNLTIIAKYHGDFQHGKSQTRSSLVVHLAPRQLVGLLVWGQDPRSGGSSATGGRAGGIPERSDRFSGGFRAPKFLCAWCPTSNSFPNVA